MPIDLVIRRADLGYGPVDITVAKGRIAGIDRAIRCDAPEVDLGGRLVVPGLVDTHVHLDKACLDDRCPLGGAPVESRADRNPIADGGGRLAEGGWPRR